MKVDDEEDRISDLPDVIIHHILSFLPSTKQAVRTGILSKRWQNQWTRVPVLIFDSTGMSYEKFLKFIDNTLVLHECLKLKKFHLRYHYYNIKDPELGMKIRFATRRYVEEINVSSSTAELLPRLLFGCDSLLKLKTDNCIFMPNAKVNWRCLVSLHIEYCKLSDQAMQHILSGSPSLESLELISCISEKIVIASKSLKRLLVYAFKVYFSFLDISCPNLEELSIEGMAIDDTQAIRNVLFGSSLLKSFELKSCCVFDQLIIASKSLKKLVLKDIQGKSFDIEISCSRLEELKLLGYLDLRTTKLLDLSSSLCAIVDFHNGQEQKTCIEILQQLQHINELKLGSWFIEILSAIKVGGCFSPVLNIKRLTLNYKIAHLIEHHYGIPHLLHISPVLEKLVINLLPYHKLNINTSGKNHWDLDAAVFDCMVSHLKTIKIVGSLDFLVRDDRRQQMLNLVEFLLKNARVLEKMIVIMEDNGRGFPLEVSQKLLNLPKCSKNAVIEMLCSNQEILEPF